MTERLPHLLRAALAMPGWAQHLGAIDPAAITTRAALATLPLLRKSDLPAMQTAAPPLAGLRAGWPAGGRVFASPGPIYETERPGPDAWRAARAFAAAGFVPGDLVLNTLSYHLSPGGFILDSGARAHGCAVIPAGPGARDQVVALCSQLAPVGYAGTPDFLKILLDAGATSITKALVSGAAFPPSLQAELTSRGVHAYQAYATADLGVVAYETQARDGLHINDGLIVEIVRPGTGDPVPDGEVGEVVVTSLNASEPWIRLALGDLSAILPGASKQGGRLRGWLGRADQSAKLRGMFVRPEQLATLAGQFPGRMRLVLTRDGEQDRALLRAEGEAALATPLANGFQAITGLRADVEMVTPGTLPNDGRVISDER